MFLQHTSVEIKFLSHLSHNNNAINLVKFTAIHLSHPTHLPINLTIALHQHLLKLHSIQPQKYKVSDTKMPLTAYMLNGRELF